MTAMKTIFRIFTIIGTLHTMGVGQATAQITYTRILPNGRFEIRQMQPNGGGDTRIPLPFNLVGFPEWSRDGSRLALTAFRPNRVTNRTWNIHERRPNRAGVVQLTNYRDILDPQTNSASYTFPWHKAYSPNNRLMAVFSLTQTGGPGSNGGGGVVDVPVLEIHSLVGTANPILVHVDKTRNGRHHGGEGVDWSPARNLIAAPLQSSAPYLSGAGFGETTAIFLIPPRLAAVQNGLARQITFPRADASIQTGVMWTEHDYQPKFSPNGNGLAYVRSFQSHSLLTSLNPSPGIQSLRIRNLTTGADRELRRFPPGRYITTLDWSPSGNQLVFDLALQAQNQVVGPLQQGNPRTNQIYVINTTTAQLTQLRGNGNGTPSWR
jgi:hypothetical protein